MRATRTRAETKRRSRAAVLVLVLASVPVVSTRLRANVLDHVLHSEAERRGRHDQLAEEWLRALRNAPGGFRAELVARRLIAIEGNLRRPAAIVPALEQLLEDGVVGGTPGRCSSTSSGASTGAPAASRTTSGSRKDAASSGGT